MNIVLAKVHNSDEPTLIKFTKNDFYNLGDNVLSTKSPLSHSNINSIFVIWNNKLKELSLSEFLKKYGDLA